MTVPKNHFVAIAEEISESPDIVQYKEVEAPQISGPNDVIIKNKYAGVNFIESYFRKGIYPAELPIVFGREASGVVAAVGSAVKDFKEGDKVLYLSSKTFAQYTKVTLDDTYHFIHKLDDDTSEEKLKLFGSILVQGLTAITFSHEAHAIKKGEFVVVWAAAGGTGQVFVQYASSLGGRVIALASTEEKLLIAKDLGAEFLVNSRNDDVAQKIRDITGGHGADVIYDGVGNDVVDINFEIVARKGSFVTFGKASGFIPPISIYRLSPKNVRISSPQLFKYITERDEWEHYSKILIDQVNNGEIKFKLETYPLKDYVKAAKALESRQTTGKLVLEIPQ